MSIPEISSRSRLIAFLKKFFVYPAALQIPRTSGPLSIATTDNIALSASTVSAASNLNTVKTIGKWPLQLHQNQADGYGLYVSRDNGTDPETYPLTWIREENAASTEPVLRVDQASEVTATGVGYGTTFELWTPGPNGSNSSLWADNRGRMTLGGDQGVFQGNGTHMVDLKTTSYFDSVTFTGTGLDDIDKWSTGYTGLTGNGAVSYRVQIDGNGTPDTFKWSTDNGVSWIATGVNCSTSLTLLADGIYVKFGATTGHTIGDYWAVDVRVVNPLRIRNAAATTIFSVHNNSRVGILDSSPSYELDVNGTVRATNDLRCDDDLVAGDNLYALGMNTTITGELDCRYDPSNSRLEYVASTRKIKNNIEYVTTSHLDKILSLRPTTYELKANPGKLVLGLIAEDSFEVDPRFARLGPDYDYDEQGQVKRNIYTDENGETVKEKIVLSDDTVPMDWDPRAVTVSLVKAVQELKAENDALKIRVEQLENA